MGWNEMLMEVWTEAEKHVAKILKEFEKFYCLFCHNYHVKFLSYGQKYVSEVTVTLTLTP